MDEEQLQEIRERWYKIPNVEWFVPEFDKAKRTIRYMASIELTTEFSIQVSPFTVGDTPMCEAIVNLYKDILYMLTEIELLKSHISELESDLESETAWAKKYHDDCERLNKIIEAEKNDG